MGRAFRRAAIVLLGVALLGSGSARAEGVFALYLGHAATADADVELQRFGGQTGLRFHDVSWEDESFRSPPYYGLRYTHWFRGSPLWGVSVDFTHAKMYAELEETVRVEGVRDGNPVSGEERLGDTFAALSFSHGHNLLLVNAHRRWNRSRRIQPYVGAGAGLALPRVEVAIEGSFTDEYQYAGLAAQALGGASVRITPRVAPFVELKVSYADIEAELSTGGRLQVQPWTGHAIIGLEVALTKAPPGHWSGRTPDQ
jgi:lipid A oxidase